MASSPLQIVGNDLIMPVGGLVDGVDVGTAVPAAQATANAALPASGFTGVATRDVLLGAGYEAVIVVRAAISGTLPAYTKTGSTGAEVLTGTGALALSVFGVSLTDGDKVLVAFNNTSTIDAGVCTYTTSSGNWRLSRTSGLNTAAVLGTSTVRVSEGRYAGQLFVQDLPPASITIGTTALMWRWATPSAVGEHGFSISTDYSGATGAIAGASANVEFQGFQHSTSGTGSQINASQTNNSDSVLGEGAFFTGSTTTGSSSVFSSTLPFTTSRWVVEYDVKFSVPVASTGGQTFTASIGFNHASATDFCKLTVSAAAGAMSVTSAVASVAGTPVSLGANFAIATQYRIVFRKAFTATLFDVWFDDGSGAGLTFKGTTTALPVSTYAGFNITSSVGTTSKELRVDFQRLRVYDPKARGG